MRSPAAIREVTGRFLPDAQGGPRQPRSPRAGVRSLVRRMFQAPTASRHEQTGRGGRRHDACRQKAQRETWLVVKQDEPLHPADVRLFCAVRQMPQPAGAGDLIQEPRLTWFRYVGSCGCVVERVESRLSKLQHSTRALHGVARKTDQCSIATRFAV